MKLTFLGAAQTVTGSCTVIEAGGKRFAIDCGMHQGAKAIEERNEELTAYDPRNIDFICVTHAHIDHSGLLPRMAAHGFSGPVYLTKPTRDLLEIMLLDSAHIQEMEAEWRSRKSMRHGNKAVQPLYTQADAEAVFPLFESVDYGQTIEPAPGVRITFRNAGHILGSAFVRVEVDEDGSTTSLVFSGDLGRPEQLIIDDPEIARTPDYLVLESTYGDRDHKDESNSLEELAEAVAYSYRNGEKVVIPAFAVERSQQVIYSLFLLSKQGKLPADMPVYLDSPLAIKATEIFRRHPEYFDPQTQGYLENGESPLDLPNLKFTLSTDESKAINAEGGPAVVISASGMCNAGRIKHHLRHNLWRPGASVVFVGYQAQGSPGRRIVNGADKITIFGEDVAVKAKVFTIGGFSGHAGLQELLTWLDAVKGPNMQVILNHGELWAQENLAGIIRERFQLTVHIPEYMEELELEPGGGEMAASVDEERAYPRVDWDFLLQDSEKLYAELRKRIEDVKQRPWVEQTEVRDRLLDVNRNLVEFISDI